MTANKIINKFCGLKQEQCLNIYPRIRQNATRRFQAAKLLTAHGDFTNGIAHLIPGTEEQIKAGVLMLQGFDFPVKEVKNYDRLFYHHFAL